MFWAVDFGYGVSEGAEEVRGGNWEDGWVKMEGWKGGRRWKEALGFEGDRRGREMEVEGYSLRGGALGSYASLLTY